MNTKLIHIKESYRNAAAQVSESILVTSSSKVEPSQSGAWVSVQVWIPAESIDAQGAP